MSATIGVIAVTGAHHLRRCLEQLVPQTRGVPVEVIVPYDVAMPGVGELSALFPHATFVDLGVLTTTAPDGSVVARHERFEQRVSAVLTRAKGTHVALLQDWGIPAPDWVRHLMEATRLPHAAMGGAIDNAAPALLNWAVYFLDFGRYQSPLGTGASEELSDMNVVYRLEDLEQIRTTWEEQYNEALVNWSLLKRGKVLWRVPELVVHHDRGSVLFNEAVAERYGWGRVFGAVRAHSMSFGRLLPYIILSPLIPVVIAVRMGAIVFARKCNRLRFLQAFPAFFTLAIVWATGELVGYLTRRPARVLRTGRVQIAS